MTTKLYEASDLNGPGRLRFPLRYPEEWYEALVRYRDRHHPHESLNEALCQVLYKHVVQPEKENRK